MRETSRDDIRRDRRESSNFRDCASILVALFFFSPKLETSCSLCTTSSSIFCSSFSTGKSPLKSWLLLYAIAFITAMIIAYLISNRQFNIQYCSKVSWQSRLDSRNSILASRRSRRSSFETRESRVENRESRIESREMRSSGIFMNSNLCEN